MRVLDIDLDFFLADCCELAAPGERPALEGHEPWAESDVIRFLETQCGLSAAHKKPGRIFPTHDGALRFWGGQIAFGALTVPFDITHVDAHSDLGIGFPGPGIVLNGVLPVRPELRANIEGYYGRKQLDEANYLLFALAFRWVKTLVNVRNPKSRPDFPAVLADPENPGALRLRSFAASLLEKQNGREPSVPYRVYDDYTSYYAKEPFDFVTLAISPRYAPKEADRLVDVIKRYIEEI